VQHYILEWYLNTIVATTSMLRKSVAKLARSLTGRRWPRNRRAGRSMMRAWEQVAVAHCLAIPRAEACANGTSKTDRLGIVDFDGGRHIRARQESLVATARYVMRRLAR